MGRLPEAGQEDTQKRFVNVVPLCRAFAVCAEMYNMGAGRIILAFPVKAHFLQRSAADIILYPPFVGILPESCGWAKI